jgi:hypothetical protein
MDFHSGDALGPIFSGQVVLSTFDCLTVDLSSEVLVTFTVSVS